MIIRLLALNTMVPAGCKLFAFDFENKHNFKSLALITASFHLLPAVVQQPDHAGVAKAPRPCRPTLMVPIEEEGNPIGKAEVSSWFRSEAADIETDVELGQTPLLFTVGFFGGILAQRRR